MKIPVQDAGAKLYDVEAPDDTPIDVVIASATKSLGREVRPVDPPTKTQFAIDRAKRGFSAAAGTLALPIDEPVPGPVGRFGHAVTELARRRFFPETTKEPKPVSRSVAEAVQRAIGYKGVPAPSTAAEWLVGKPAEFAGASAIPSAVTVARAAKPVTAALTELAGTYAGGVGSKAGEEYGGAIARGGAKVMGASPQTQEEVGQAGRDIGGLVGGAGTIASAGMALPRVAGAGVEYVRKGLIPKLKDEGEIEKVASSLFTKHFRESLISDPRYKVNLEQALKTREQIPGFDPDLSMAAGTPAVRALQTHAETQSPAAAAHGVAKREGAIKALNEYRDAHFGQGEKTLQELSAGELEAADRGLAAQQAALDVKGEALRERVRSGQFGPQEGRELEALKKEQYKSALARADAQYTQVYQLADRVGYQGSLDPAIQYIQGYKRDLNRVAQKTPAVVTDLEQAVKRAALETRKTQMKSIYTTERMPDGITAFVAKNGGLSKKELGGELPDIGQTPNFAQRGKDYSFWLVHDGPSAKTSDEMLLRAKQSGYLPEGASINDLVAALDDELRAGEHIYFSTFDSEAAARIMQRIAAEKAEDLGAQGVEFNAGAKYPAGFGPMHSILKRIRQEKRFYASRSTDEARLAMKPLNDLEGIVTEAIGTAGPEVSSRLAQADALFKENVADVFYNGVAAQSFNDRGLIENVARRMLTKGEEGAKNFKQVYGESERANDLLWNGVIDSLAARLGEREVSSKVVQAFYEHNKKFLDQFPTIKTRLLAVDSAARGLEDRALTLAEQKRAVTHDLISTLVGRPDPEKYLVSIVQNEAAMKQVAGWAGKNPDMGKQIVRAYVDGIMDKPDPAAVLLANERTLKPVFDAIGKDHWNKALTLVTGETIRKRGAADPLFKPEVVTDPLRVITGTGTSGIFSRIRGAVYRQISPEYVLVDVGGKYFFRIQQEQAREAINAALYDPKLIDNILALDHELSLPTPPWEKVRNTMAEMKKHYANNAIRVGVVQAQAASEPREERKHREARDRALRGYWQGIEARAFGGPVVPGRPYIVGEAGPEIIVPKDPGTVIPGGMTGVRGAVESPVLMAEADPMGIAAKNRYREATGASIDAGELNVPAPARSSQGVVPIPANVEGLAQLLLKTGRARTIEEARAMAQVMAAQRP